MERYALGFICLQGGGLYIYGTATLTNTNVYSNEAGGVRARLLPLPRHLIHRPTGMHTAERLSLCHLIPTHTHVTFHRLEPMMHSVAGLGHL